MQTLYLLQIVQVHPPHDVARLPAGGPLEVDLIEACVRAIVAKGVGLLRTSAHVEQDIRDGMIEALQAVKEDSRYAVR